ncbi:MAG: hypothetical protein N2109_07565 [Fimbriimonadales bacterium]|nr:hypothetical protein [Fimbriimonadales bacterium]
MLFREAKPEDQIRDESALRQAVGDAVGSVPVFDIHTHLFPFSFERLCKWGIDDLLTYHYLVAELFRSCEISPKAFFDMPEPRQADLIWRKLFVENPPLSEATAGVCTVLAKLGLDPRAKTLDEAREFFADVDPHEHLEVVLELAGVSDLAMTNDPLDDQEALYWQSDSFVDPRFHAVIRLDPILCQWETSWRKLEARGYKVDAEASEQAVDEVHRFLDSWSGRLQPRYLAVSLPPDFAYPDDSPRTRLLEGAVLHVCRELDVPLALMVGVRRGVNPELGLAGDGVGWADVSAIERLCARWPENRFLATLLALENQHQLLVASRKFANLMPFGCWWFVNNPSTIESITRLRFEMLGATFIPQHSDARVLEQLIYKWDHSRRVVAEALFASFRQLQHAGWFPTKAEIESVVRRLFQGNARGMLCLDQIQAPLSVEVRPAMSQVSDDRPKA